MTVTKRIFTVTLRNETDETTFNTLMEALEFPKDQIEVDGNIRIVTETFNPEEILGGIYVDLIFEGFDFTTIKIIK